MTRFVAALGAVLAAVGVSASPAAALRPCSLLTNAEVARALGVKIQTRTSRPFTCTWQSVPLGNFTTASRSVTLQADRLTRAKFEAMGKHSLRLTPYKGIGDLAYITPDGNGSYELEVWSRGVALDLSAVEVSSPLATEKHLAAIVLKRL